MGIIRRFAEPLGFPEDSCAVLEAAYEKLAATPGALDILRAAEESLFLSEARDFVEILKPVYELTDIEPYCVDMVFLLTSAQPLLYLYRAKGLSDELFYETMRDLLYKLRECLAVYGVHGTFVIEWYKRFYTCERFKLGRLQFETREYPIDEPFRDIYAKGDTVIGCHIPSSGPLCYEDVVDSLRQAYEFYSDRLIDGKLYVYCHSWLMFPPYAKTVFPEGSNLYRFLNLFELVRTEEDERYKDFVRVFSKYYKEEELDELPEDTGLRRRLKKFLQDGNKMGEAYGFIEFDGQNILTEKK